MKVNNLIIPLFLMLCSLVPFLFLGFDIFIFSIYSIVIYFFVLFYFFKFDKDFFLINSFIFYGGVTTLLISLILENGIYLVEIGRQSYALHVPEKAVTQLISFSLGSCLIFSFLKKSNFTVLNLTEKLNFTVANFFRLLVVLGILITFLIATKYGTPLTHGVHRNDYWTYYAPSWGGVVTYWIMQLNFILGVLFSKNKKKIDVLLLLAILTTIFMMGERFTGLVYSLFFFFLPFFINGQKINIKISKIKIFIIGIIAVFGIGYTLINSFSKIDSNTSPIESVMIRASLQSQMWWALDELSDFYPKDVDILYNKYWGFDDIERNVGVYYLMDQVASKSIVDARYETKSRFTMSGFFNNIYFFGYLLGTLINFLWGCFFGVISYFFYKSIISFNIIFSFFAFKLFFKMQAMLLNATITDVFSLETIVFFLVCCFFIRFK